jgi:hypothetical protein
MNRRKLLSSIALGSAAVVLAGCQSTGGGSTSTIAAQAASDIGLIASGLTGALSSLSASNTVSPSAVSQITGYINAIEAVAATVTTATSATAGQTAVQQIETLLNSLVSAASGLPLPAPFSTALSAASVLLPVVEVAVGLVTTASAGATVPMTPAQARLILSGSAHH